MNSRQYGALRWELCEELEVHTVHRVCHSFMKFVPFVR